MKPQLREVRRLPAQKTVVALFVVTEPGRRVIKRRDFADMVAAYLIDNRYPIGQLPKTFYIDIYEEWWREEPYVRGGLGKPVVRATRIKRCRSTDEGAYLVTAIDLKKWSRGRRVKEAAK